MKQLKFILPLILAIFVIYFPLQIKASNTQYDITFIQNSFSGDSSPDWFSTNKIQLLDSVLIFPNSSQHISFISIFENDLLLGGYIFRTSTVNSPYIRITSNVNSLNVINDFPTATHFYINTYKGTTSAFSSFNNTTNFTTFSSILVSYNNPTPTPLEVNTPNPVLTFTDGFQMTSNNLYLIESSDSNLPRTYGYVFGTTTNPTINNNIANLDMTGLGSATVTGLQSNTTYNYRGYLILDGNVYYGLNKIATTDAVQFPVLPSIDISIAPNLNVTLLAPPYTPGNLVTVVERGIFITNNGTVPSVTNFTQNFTLGLSNQLEERNFDSEFDKQYRIVHYVRSSNNEYFYSSVMTLNTPKEQFTVTFLDWDDTLIATLSAESGSTPQLPPNPTRVGYTFTGWEPPVINISGDLITVAQYTLNSYTITFKSLGQVVQQSIENHFTNINTIIPTVTYEGHNLLGFYIEGDSSETLININSYQVNQSATLVAKWADIPVYTVTFYDPQLNILKIETVQEGNFATPPNLTPTSGFTVVWPITINTAITSDLLVVAAFQPIDPNDPTTSGVTPTDPTTPENYSPIADLFGGVIGASIGAIMTLGTIELYGITLNSLIFLFVSMSLGLWILKAIRG
jgi:hypothetical protein